MASGDGMDGRSGRDVIRAGRRGEKFFSRPIDGGDRPPALPMGEPELPDEEEQQYLQKQHAADFKRQRAIERAVGHQAHRDGITPPGLIRCFKRYHARIPPENNMHDSALMLTGHWTAIAALTVFAVAYLLVIAEETLHLRKSKPMMVAAGLIWMLVAYAHLQAGEPERAAEVMRHNLLEFAELFLFLLAAMTYINTME